MTNHIDQEPTEAQYARFGRRVAAMLGSASEWDADMFEDIDAEAERHLALRIGSTKPEALAFWRQVADSEGIEYE